MTFEFQLQFLWSSADFAVKREPEQVGGRISEIVNQLDRRALITESVFICRRVVAVAPVSQIESHLQMVGHAEFDLMPKIHRIEATLVAHVIQFSDSTSPGSSVVAS
jgi:hypothetical protein